MFGIAQAQTLGAVKKDRMTIGWVRTSLSWVGTRPVDSLDKNVGKVTPWGGEKESQVIQTLVARIQLAMRAEEARHSSSTR